MNEDDMQIGLGLMLTLVSRGFEPSLVTRALVLKVFGYIIFYNELK